MRPKPRSYRFRNLHARGDAIYYERLWRGKRFCFSTKTDDWSQAAAVRDLFEERKGIGRLGVAVRVEAPRFAEFAKRYLIEDTAALAPTTRREREHLLAADGPILSHLGTLALDAISDAYMRAWWAAAVDARSLATKTGRNMLDAIAGVFSFALELGLVDASPVDAFRRTLSRKSRTKRGRAEGEAGRDVRPSTPTSSSAWSGRRAARGSSSSECSCSSSSMPGSAWARHSGFGGARSPGARTRTTAGARC